MLHMQAGGVHAQTASVAGAYFCAASGTCPCQSDTLLHLREDGRWRWGEFTGNWHRTQEGVVFDGNGGAATLGAAAIGEATLTFNSGSLAVVCWQPSGAGTHARPLPR
jgi:hypothetical protein